MIEQKIDRMIVNVDASVTNVGSTALEVLEKSPGVSVDKDGNISLKGKSQVMVMIDGKPAYLSGTDLANLLSNMNANQLSQIEIMTDPSAKYDAAGNAGVINIKTKKSITQGLNGNVTLNYGQGVYAKSNNNIALNYRTGKINTFLNYGYTINNGFFTLDREVNFIGADGRKTYGSDQTSTRYNRSQNNNIKLGLDYFINPATTIGIAASGFLSPQRYTGTTITSFKDSIDNLSFVEKTNRTGTNTWKNGSVNLNFHSTLDSSGKEITTHLDYLHYDFSGNQNIASNTYSADDILQRQTDLKNILPLKIDIYSARIDYAQPLANGFNLETGIKSSVVKTNNISAFFDLNGGAWKINDTISNNFNYQENINAAYVNLNKKFAKWNLQAGFVWRTQIIKGCNPQRFR